MPIVRPHPFLALAAIAVLLALSACASRTAARMGSAAITPLGDLNIIRTDIPPVLAEAKGHPYQAPPDRSCAAIGAEIAELDAVLGADLDAKAPPRSDSLLDRGSDLAEDQAVGAVQRTAEGLVPFRSWVRKLSGAERHAKHVSESRTAGEVRRAFLKGMAVSAHCPGQDAAPAQSLAAGS